MPNILDRMLDAATNRRYGQPASTMIREARAFRAVAQEEPWRFSPIGPTLRELDSETMDWLMNTLGYETIGYLGGKPTLTATENDRIACVKRIRHLYCYDALVNRSVGVWTDYGFGEDVALTVTAEGESKEGECQALWDAFWTDPENEPIFGARHLQELSNQLLVDGELFMALFASKTAGSVIGDGKVIVRLVPTEQITELVAPPDDNATPGYFKRAYLDANGSQVTIYYPNLQASAARRKRARDLLPSGSRFAEDERPGTDVCMLQVPFKLINGRGWPLPSASYRWAEEYTQFLRDRAAINRAINAYTSKAKVKGGTRGVAAVKAAFASTIGQGTYGYETNPPAGAGSTLITNEAVDWQRLPMASGASDARVDGMALLSEYAAGVALPPFLLGRTDTMQNRATADTSLRPTLRAWNRYQTFWASIFTDLCNYVLDCAEQYGVRPVKYTGREIMVSLDSPLETDFYELTKAINESVGASTLRAQEASRILLERPELNIPNPSAVWDEMYGEAQAQSESETPEEEPNPEPAEELHREMLIQLAREAWFTAPSEEQRIAARIFTEENGAIVEGSASSGNFGHAGIPGHRGGSASGGGFNKIGVTRDMSPAQRVAKVRAHREEVKAQKAAAKAGGGAVAQATKAANETIDKMGRATGGETRQVAGQKINTADIINQSLDVAKKMPVDLDGARNALQRLGHKSPPDALVQRYAHEERILKAIQKITGANTTGQSGKWNMSTAETLHRDFNKYLWRRVLGQRQQWTKSHNK